MFKTGGIFAEISLGQAKQGRCRLGTVLLEVNKGACQLDKAFIKQVTRTATLIKPEFLQNLMRLEEKLAVETLEKSKVMGLEFLTAKGFDDESYFRAFVAHLGPRVASL